MHEFLEAALIAMGAAASAAALSLGVMLRRLRRANRVVPSRRSAAPLSWRWSPSRAALLHRRLRRACEIIGPIGEPARTATQRPRRLRGRRAPAAEASVLASVRVDLLERAVAADARLVEIHRHRGRWRWAHLPPIAAEVAAIEQGADRLVHAHRRVQERALAPGVVDERAEQLLDAYEAALDELTPTPPPAGVSQPRRATR